MRDVCIVHYDELALKGGRREYYEERLGLAVKTATRDLGTVAVERLYGRFVVWTGKSRATLPELAERLSRICGVRVVLTGRQTAPELSTILEAALGVLAEFPPDATFAVRVKKADPSFPFGESELERELGALLVAATGRTVRLVRPDARVQIEIVNGRAFVAAKRLRGPGGLPIGTSGRGVALISGGIDSPVAAWLMMARGLKISVVHFHSAPYTSRASQEKVRELLKALTRRQPTIEAAFIPFATTVQREIVERAPARLRILLYRRFMVRIAAALAGAVGAKCLVTGDALAQVASQTISNIGTIDAAAPIPVFRPLIGMNKDRIIEEARAIGTYDISIQADEDCCSYLEPRRPATTSTSEDLAAAEESLDVPALVAAAVKAREVFSVRFDA